MKLFKYICKGLIPLVLFISPSMAPAQTAPLKVESVVGTGQTTGHIGSITVLNPSENPIEVRPQVFYIPATGKYQSYVGRIPGGNTIPSGASVAIPVTGYCTDIHSPPVPDGEAFSPIEKWVPVGLPSELDDLTGIPILINNTVPGFQLSQIGSISGSPGFSPSLRLPGGDITPSWPGTHTPVGGTIDHDAMPADFAALLVTIVERLETAANDLVSTGEVTTPFANDEKKQYETLVQQSTWIVVGAMTGEPYEKGDFSNVVYTQFRNNTGTSVGSLPDEQKEKIDSGIDTFWDGFIATGIEAKVLVSADAMEEIPVLVTPWGWACGDYTDLGAELKEDFDDLNKLKGALDEVLKKLSENELAKEVEAIRSLFELIEMLKGFNELDEELFSDLKSFIGCNSDPLRKKMETVDGFKRSVLRPLRFLLAYLKASVDNNPTLSDLEKKLFKAAIYLLDKKISSMDKALDKPGGLEEAVQIFETIKTDPDWPEEVLKNKLESIWDDLILEVKNKFRSGSKFLIKLVLKKILGSGQAASALAGIVLDFYDFFDLLLLLDDLDELERQWNLKLIEILGKARNGGMVVSKGSTCNSTWNLEAKDLAEIHTQMILRCWCPDPEGKPGEGKWEDLPLQIKPKNGKATTLHVHSTKENSGEIEFKIEVPPKEKWPCKGENCMLLHKVEAYNAAGRLIGSRTSFAGAM